MHSPAEEPSLHQQNLDWLFARLAGQPVGDMPAAPAQPEADENEPRPAPEVRSAEDLKLATDWLRRERGRLEAYTRTQIQRIQQEHQALIGQTYLNEQSLILRSQEMARKEEMLLSQGRALQEQAQQLTEREQGLSGQLQEWWKASEQLANIEEATAHAAQDAEQHRALAHALQAETQALQLAREKARDELESLLAATEDLRTTRVKEEATLRARHDQLDDRLREADRVTLAAQQQQAELDDLEMRLRNEVEEQERELLRQRQTIDAQAASLKLEQAALAQRQAELDELQDRLDVVYDDLEQRLGEFDQKQAQQDEELERRAQELQDKLDQLEADRALTPAGLHPDVTPTDSPARRSGSHPGTTRFDRWLAH